ncbi:MULTISPECIES: MarR family winged helix-turn-helix transcriptional regulator [unclassified Pantoea]|jgi:DNA-binding MarR family transcriptional regulator|uniref:MarR family winged helix-turn-helix transcriptional regulator n=1 Tax=unclassified Pantoea TaxID=2630326 RepID=UPI001CD681C7|nr:MULTISPECIES: MarR family winged helix-turn-helix transcriptional regulator [unclassified Pantoea]MCA1179681.1 MarR family winged helix-turn-helix transcriptional regulator [Pantoea sp. alder69]MCA1253340.1 MarR family winged helix-turn-helix transcriptional regulator [Pantoea sp. alder70]MCA1268024.1 MarR family winged helix-turn-helix transcriptional regulator [Pantoea sp. alder81]
MKSVQNTHNSAEFDDLHNALLMIVGTFNRPQRDELLIKESNIQLDRALFPLLIQIGRFGPIGVVELAERAGRDYTTVSRQVAKLEELGLAQRQKNARDKRVNEAVITAAGKTMTDKIDAARAQIYQHLFENWQDSERTELARLLQKFVGDFMAIDRNA